MTQSTFGQPIKGSLLAAAFVLFASGAGAENVRAVLPMTLSPSQIVEQVQRHDKAQAESLQYYHALRHYTVEYRGFFGRMEAKMDVEVDYSASGGKSFRIVSVSGSHVLCERVLKRAVASEKEASLNGGATALTEANYRFRLLGSDNLGGRPAYILDVEPLTSSKFLYRGRIWVDAGDFAVVKLEVQPARNPSFWISQTLIHHTYARTDGFWLPEQNRSETRVRIGGAAVLTIDYGTYQIVPRSLHPAVEGN